MACTVYHTIGVDNILASSSPLIFVLRRCYSLSSSNSCSSDVILSSKARRFAKPDTVGRFLVKSDPYRDGPWEDVNMIL